MKVLIMRYMSGHTSSILLLNRLHVSYLRLEACLGHFELDSSF